jgi:hypothetical protein
VVSRREIVCDEAVVTVFQTLKHLVGCQRALLFTAEHVLAKLQSTDGGVVCVGALRFVPTAHEEREDCDAVHAR